MDWRRRSDDIMVAWTRMYDWTPPATQALREAGLRLGIVSTKYRSRIASTLERHGLTDRFDVIIGGEDVERHKPHPEGLHRAVEGLRVPVDQTLYVGDTVADAVAAREAGSPFVAVLSGMTRAEEFDPHPKVAVLPHVGGLPELLRATIAK